MSTKQTPTSITSPNDSGLDMRFRAYCERYSNEIGLAEIEGMDIIIHPRVYRAEGASTTATLLQALGSPTGQRVLDMGCGTGVLGIFAALRGAKHVILADKSPEAVENARANVQYHGFSDRCEVIESDLFGALGEARFDLIMFNMPFLYGDGRPLEFPVSSERRTAIPREDAFMDVGYGMIRRFLTEAPHHLSRHGTILCSFASFGNHQALDAILSDNGLTRRTAAIRVEERYGLEYLAYEISPLRETA